MLIKLLLVDVVGECIGGKCSNGNYLPSCSSKNPLNSIINVHQCLAEEKGTQWSMSCSYDSYDGILCKKGCNLKTGYCN